MQKVKICWLLTALSDKEVDGKSACAAGGSGCSRAAAMRLELDTLRGKYEALQGFARTVAAHGPPAKVATASVITIVKSGANQAAYS